ncbi:MAG: glycosyltransferase family 2 protein [Patescibacteria group bacterium]|nr:glycosyltransferase family 2 protein [Patescibacteria group bacterium]
MKSIDISIVIPAYNEEKNIRIGALDKVARYLEHIKYSWEVIVVDDGSTDMTKRLLADFANQNKGFRIIFNPHQGKAATVITGMLAATGDIILFTDLDQATPIHEIKKLLPFFEKGYDVVIGSRSKERQGAPMLRKIMAQGFMVLRSVILGLHGIVDTQCGFKAFRRDIAHDVFQSLKRYGRSHEISGSMVTAGFDIEVLFIAKRKGYRIKEVPVEWHYVETRRVNPLKDSLYGLFDIIAIRLNALRGLY